MPGQSPGPRDMSDREEEPCLDQQLWQACAGSMVQLPSVGSKIVYFAQGHAEQAAASAACPDLPRSLGSYGAVPCRVLGVKLLADKETDEVFAKLRLQPEGTFGGEDSESDAEAEENEAASGEKGKPASFAKTLTQSDANNGGGFSVPRYCAETIFPKLDYSVDPPVQTVLAKDVHGEVWKFRHIYRGTPRRHLLTTGWSTFVNQKKLVAGDAIVFLRSKSGELCLGVRRSMRAASNTRAGSRWELMNYPEALIVDAGSNGSSRSSGGGFSRNRPKVTAKSVHEAATLAACGKPFEVVYYPRASTAEFCVRARSVRTALSHAWYAGMRFKMAFETEDSSRISWFMGTISAVEAADPVFWPNSPWRVLQVAWDEPDLLQGLNRVSPWQVELVSTLPMQLPPFSLPRKKFRASQPEVQNFSTLPTTTNGVLGQVNPWHGLSAEGMQGARHEGLTFSDCQPNRLQAGLLDRFQPQDIAGTRTTLSYGATDLRLGNSNIVNNNNNNNNLNSSAFVHDRAQMNLMSLCNNNNNNNSQNESSVSWTGSSSNRQGTILLFGKKIEASRPQEQQQNSAGSSSEATSRQQQQQHWQQQQQQPSGSSSGESQNDNTTVQQNVQGSPW